MDKHKIITYSLLAHINNSGTLSTGLLDIFIPLVKRALSFLSRDGITKGRSISEIKLKLDDLYKLDFPIPVLRVILTKISKENNQTCNPSFIIYSDDAFSINEYIFLDFEETINSKEQEINQVELYYIEFCKINSLQNENCNSIFEFIEKNKFSISKYLTSNNIDEIKGNFLPEAQFVNYFRSIPNVYNIIKDIYLGSIISTYIEFKTQSSKRDIELVFDTNFIIGLLDLNTPESNHTCNKLIEVGKSSGYKLTVLNITIEECKKIIYFKSENFNRAGLQRKVNPEDIYNACDRRNLNKTDLERLSDNIQMLLEERGITIIPNTDKYQNIAKYSEEYKHLKTVRNTEFAALHDATVHFYVKEKRANVSSKNFEDTKCWFVHNSVTKGEFSNTLKAGKQSESIKSDDLLNILWLANPGITRTLESRDLADIGLTSLISSTFSDALPRSSIIKELDDNIQKYQTEENPITEKDVLRIATRISHRQLKNIEELNTLAAEDSNEFVLQIKNEAEKQRIEDEEKVKKFEKVILMLEDHVVETKKRQIEIDKTKNELDRERSTLISKQSQSDETIEKLKIELENQKTETQKQKEERRKDENIARAEKRAEYIQKRIWKWRMWTIIPLFVLLISFLIVLTNDDCILFLTELSNSKDTLLKYKNLIFLSVFEIALNSLLLKLFYDRCFNNSNIKAYTDRLIIPDKYHELKN